MVARITPGGVSRGRYKNRQGQDISELAEILRRGGKANPIRHLPASKMKPNLERDNLPDKSKITHLPAKQTSKVRTPPVSSNGVTVEKHEYKSAPVGPLRERKPISENSAVGRMKSRDPRWDALIRRMRKRWK
jgi:hypothetical protein